MFSLRLSDVRLSDHQLRTLSALERLLAHVAQAMPRLVAPDAAAALAEPVTQAEHEIQVAFPEAPVATRGALKAGLWLLADDLDRCHKLCQDIQTPFGSAWHAAMHRREGDFSNSCYWWRRASAIEWVAVHDGDDLVGHILLELRQRWKTGDEPPALAAFEEELEDGEYDPATFVELVERERDNAAVRDFLVNVQRMEWLHLFAQCLDAAREGK